MGTIGSAVFGFGRRAARTAGLDKSGAALQSHEAEWLEACLQSESCTASGGLRAAEKQLAKKATDDLVALRQRRGDGTDEFMWRSLIR
jgi:hypothetical protein